ncbi:MAG: hypothetical protein A2020_15155 [Lentisphaerae bacterium GWF2_45_14]|nr:MAG: hypothetical protein A2020_15155 [Lentisphaerae bacterium GWF2_45_14]
MKKKIRLLFLFGVLALGAIIFKLYFWENVILAVSEFNEKSNLLNNSAGILIAGQDGKLRLEISARTLDEKLKHQKLKIKTKNRIITQGEMELTRKKTSAIFTLGNLKPGERYSDIIVEFGCGDDINNMRPPLTPVNVPFGMALSGKTLTVELSDKNNPEIFPHSPFKVKAHIRNEKHKLLSTVESGLGESKKLDIPNSGEFTITVELENYYGDLIGRRTIAYKDGKEENLSQDGKPVTLAVASFLDFTGTIPAHVIVTIAARDRVVSDLVQNYDCVIISRANGLTLSTENMLNRLNASGNEAPSGFIPAADYAIIGHFTMNTVLDNGYKDDFITSLFITDLRNNDNKEIKDVFKGEYRTGYNEEIVPEIAAKLKLRPRTKKHLPMTEKQIDETWAVLPFSKLVSSDSYAIAESDPELSMKMELALQESGKIKRIVDHSEIDKIMQEAKISMANGISESTAAGIARILGAEKVVTGQISKSKFREDERYRIDLLLIDGKKAVVLDAVSAICEQSSVEKTASTLLMKFTQRKYTVPAFTNQSPEMRIKEAKIYIDFIKGIADHNARDYLAVREGLTLAEAAYMLINDNPAWTYWVADRLLYKIMYNYDDTVQTTEEGKKAADLMEKMLGNLSPSKETPEPLIMRADAQLRRGNYEKAISLVNRYLKETKLPINTFAYYLKAKAYYAMKDYVKSLEFAKKCDERDCRRLVIDLYWMLGDEENEFKMLDENGSHSLTSSLRFMILARKFKGSEYALKRYDKLPFDRRPEMRLQKVKCLLELNRKSEAAVLLNGLQNVKLSSSTDKKAFDGDVETALNNLKDIQIEWKTPVQVRKISDKYKLYIRPLGITDTGIINDTAKELEKRLEVKVVVLPAIPMPDDSASYVKTYGQYDISYVMKRIIRVFPVPEDAIMLVHITGCDLFDNTTWTYHTSYGAFVSYVQLGGILKKEYGEYLAKIISGILVEIAFKAVPGEFKGGRKCESQPCLLTRCDKPNLLINTKFEMCPTCQQEYKKVDFEKLNEIWQNMYKNMPQLKDGYYSQERALEYKKKVEKFLAEQKE